MKEYLRRFASEESTVCRTNTHQAAQHSSEQTVVEPENEDPGLLVAKDLRHKPGKGIAHHGASGAGGVRTNNVRLAGATVVRQLDSKCFYA
jgi:hypothetical protein